MNAKKQTPKDPEFCLAASKGSKGVRRDDLRRGVKYSRPHSRLPRFTVARRGRGHERR
jgi:hypothetical protein